MYKRQVRYYDAEKGFGFLSKDEGGEDVYVRASALPDGVTTLKRGQKVEFGVVDGKKGCLLYTSASGIHH